MSEGSPRAAEIPAGDNALVRVSAKADYALRAMVQLAADTAATGTNAETEGPVTAARLAEEQQIPVRFLHGVLTELRRARLVRSTRGKEGGFELLRPAAEISLADVLRAVDGPMVNVRDTSLGELVYPGPTEPMRDVWMAARASLRQVFERVSIADLADGALPSSVAQLAADYRDDSRRG
jgi:Rrf2 family protein